MIRGWWKKLGRRFPQIKTIPAFELGLDLIREDSNRVVDIIEFATSPEFCGLDLYAEQKLILKLIYHLPLDEKEAYIFDYWKKNDYVPEDILERGESLPHFNEIVLVIGRRGGKTFLSSILVAYMVYRLINLGNPQQYFNIQEDKEIFIYCVARSGLQTKNTIYSDIKNIILSCPWLHDWIYPEEGVTSTEIRIQTPRDKERQRALLRKGITPTSPIASLRIASMHSNSTSLRGPAIIMAVYTEFAHFLDSSGNMSGEAVYEAIDPSVKTFGSWGMQILDSTPWMQLGKFYERYLAAWGKTPEGNDLEKWTYDNIIGFHIPSWEMYKFSDWANKTPIITFDDVKQKAVTNPDTFWTEWGAQFSQVVDAYFDSQLVENAFDPRISLKDRGIHKFVYKIHCDPSESGANFGVVGGHAEKIRGSIWEHEFPPHMLDRYLVVIDYIKAYRPSDFKDNRIDYIQIEKEIVDLALRFNADEISFDQWNSISSIQHIKEELRRGGRIVNVHKINFTQKSNFERYENLKSAMLQNLVKIPKGREGDDAHYLMLELKFLQKKGERVEKQNSGLIKTKDLADCLGQVVWNLLGDIRGGTSFPRIAPGLPAGENRFDGHTSFDAFYSGRMR